MPTVVGLLRPTILLPITFATGLSPGQVEAILIHELEHIRRHDFLVNLFQRVVEAALFFHPAVWWVSRRIRIEREHCCDDAVVAAGCEPMTYAESLVTQAERALAARAGRCAAAAALYADGGSGDLRGRVARILRIPSNGEVRIHLWPLALLAILALSIATTYAVGKAAKPVFTKADVTIRVDEQGEKLAAKPVAIVLTDPAEVAELAAFFPRLGTGRESARAGAWQAGVTITFVTASGEAVKVSVSGNDNLTVWSEGKGDWPVMGDFKALVEKLRTRPPGEAPWGEPVDVPKQLATALSDEITGAQIESEWNGLKTGSEFLEFTMKTAPNLSRLIVMAQHDPQAEAALERLAKLEPHGSREVEFIPGIAATALQDLHSRRTVQSLLADAKTPREQLEKIHRIFNDNPSWLDPSAKSDPKEAEEQDRVTRILVLRAVEVGGADAVALLVRSQLMDLPTAKKLSQPLLEYAKTQSISDLCKNPRTVDYVAWTGDSNASILLKRWLDAVPEASNGDHEKLVMALVGELGEMANGVAALDQLLDDPRPSVVAMAALRLWGKPTNAKTLAHMEAARDRLSKTGAARKSLEQLSAAIKGSREALEKTLPPNHTIGIYRVTGGILKGASFDKVPLTDLTLADDALITQDDIYQYDWESHTIRLKTQAAADRILRPNSTNVPAARFSGAFVLVVDGQRLYSGQIRWLGSSYVASTPFIEAGPAAEQWQPAKAIRIHPPPKDMADPRDDARLKKALQDLSLMPKASFSDTVERVIGLSKAPHTTDCAALPDLFEAQPAGSKSYELRGGLIVGYNPTDLNFVFGNFYYLPEKEVFYVQHDPIGSSSSTRTYYGPFKGKPWEVLGVPQMTRLRVDPWGETVDGVQVRLRAYKVQWQAGEIPTFAADARNQGTFQLRGSPLLDYDVLIDGQWFHRLIPEASPESLEFGPGKEFPDTRIRLLDREMSDRATHKAMEELKPGKHTVRVAFSARVPAPAQGKAVRAVSNPVEFTVEKAEFDLSGVWTGTNNEADEDTNAPASPNAPSDAIVAAAFERIHRRVAALAAQHPVLEGAGEVKPHFGRNLSAAPGNAQWQFARNATEWGKAQTPSALDPAKPFCRIVLDLWTQSGPNNNSQPAPGQKTYMVGGVEWHGYAEAWSNDPELPGLVKTIFEEELTGAQVPRQASDSVARTASGPQPAQFVKARDPLQTMDAAHQLLDGAPDDATPSAQRDLCKGPPDFALRDDVTVIQLPPSNYPAGSDDIMMKLFYRPSVNRFYLRFDMPDKRVAPYRGPFEGNPYEKLHLTPEPPSGMLDKQSGKVFSESELVAMGYTKTDLRPHYLEPVFVKKAVPLGDLARELCFAVESIEETMQISIARRDDAHHVIIPTGICYIEYISQADERDGGSNVKSMVNATVLQVPLQPFTDEKNTAKPALEDAPRKLGEVSAPATQPGAAKELAGPADGLLPGAEIPLAEAMKGQVTLVAALQAVGPPRLEPGFSGVVYATQTFRLLDSFYEHEKAGETITIRYGYLVPGMHSGRTDRAVRADEKVVWILHNDTFGIDRGTKALPDTPENRLAARKLVEQLPANLRETVEAAKTEARLTARLFAIKPKGWSGGSMSGGKVEPLGWEVGKGMKFVWTRMDDRPELMTGRVTVWIMDAEYSGKRNLDAGNPAYEIAVWHGRRVFFFGNGDVWPTANADILQELKAKDAQPVSQADGAMYTGQQYGPLLRELQAALPPKWGVRLGSQPGQASLMVDRTEKADGIVEIDNGPDTPNKPTPQEVLFSFQSMPYVTPEEYRKRYQENAVKNQARLKFEEKLRGMSFAHKGPQPIPPSAYNPATEAERQLIQEYEALWRNTEPVRLPGYFYRNMAFSGYMMENTTFTNPEVTKEIESVREALGKILKRYK